MTPFPIFLSVVYVVRNQAAGLADALAAASSQLSSLVSDHELIVVDNGSDDESVRTLKSLTLEGGLPNVQVFALTQEVDFDTACWAGIENALGDFVAVIDPLHDDIGFLPTLLDRATRGPDLVFGANLHRSAQNLGYRLAYSVLASLYKAATGVHLARQAPHYRVMNRRVVNFILQHPRPAVAYRLLPGTAGFVKEVLEYRAAPSGRRPKRLRESIDRGMQLLVSSGRAPLRLVTVLSTFGAIANVLYSIYVLAIAMFKADVAAGWVSLSLQQSGMFLLISLVLLVFGEYVLQMASLHNEGPPYHIGQEFTSAQLTRRHRLNVDEAGTAPPTERVEAARSPG